MTNRYALGNFSLLFDACILNASQDKKSICYFICEASEMRLTLGKNSGKVQGGNEIARFHFAKLEMLQNRIDYPRLSRLNISE